MITSSALLGTWCGVQLFAALQSPPLRLVHAIVAAETDCASIIAQSHRATKGRAEAIDFDCLNGPNRPEETLTASQQSGTLPRRDINVPGFSFMVSSFILRCNFQVNTEAT